MMCSEGWSILVSTDDKCVENVRRSKQLLTKVRSFIVTVLSRRLNIRLVLLQPLRHQLISQTEQVPTRI